MPTILFVEDDPLIMLSAAATLEDQGWVVKKAANGVVAMERFPELSADVDAMVVDIKLGLGPNGWDVAKFARSVSNRIPVVYVTGDEAGAQASLQGVEGGVILQKPVSDADLLAVLRNLIGMT